MSSCREYCWLTPTDTKSVVIANTQYISDVFFSFQIPIRVIYFYEKIKWKLRGEKKAAKNESVIFKYTYP